MLQTSPGPVPVRSHRANRRTWCCTLGSSQSDADSTKANARNCNLWTPLLLPHKIAAALNLEPAACEEKGDQTLPEEALVTPILGRPQLGGHGAFGATVGACPVSDKKQTRLMGGVRCVEHLMMRQQLTSYILDSECLS